MSDKDFLWLHLRDLPYFRSITRAVEAQFFQQFELSRPILDIGSGDGHFASVTFAEPLDVGLDPWTGPIREAKKRGCYRLLIQADAGDMPLKSAYFGSAISNSVLEHIPHIDAVLAEISRVLQPGALFVFSVPNPAYFSELSIAGILNRAGLAGLGRGYTEWFRRISRVQHADPPDVWSGRLESAGFKLDRWFNYLSPQAWQMVEWGHYFGAPTLLPHFLIRRWLWVPSRWNLALTERIVRPYTQAEPDSQGTFTFFIAHKKKSNGH